MMKILVLLSSLLSSMSFASWNCQSREDGKCHLTLFAEVVRSRAEVGPITLAASSLMRRGWWQYLPVKGIVIRCRILIAQTLNTLCLVNGVIFAA
jgi:hypothetical protein